MARTKKPSGLSTAVKPYLAAWAAASEFRTNNGLPKLIKTKRTGQAMRKF